MKNKTRKVPYWTKKKQHLKYKYGIALNVYKALLVQQKYLCAICSEPETAKGYKLSVDHNHKTGIVRGLLCFSCNRGLGYFRENKKYLKNAISYLRKESIRG